MTEHIDRAIDEIEHKLWAVENLHKRLAIALQHRNLPPDDTEYEKAERFIRRYGGLLEVNKSERYYRGQIMAYRTSLRILRQAKILAEAVAEEL